MEMKPTCSDSFSCIVQNCPISFTKRKCTDVQNKPTNKKQHDSEVFLPTNIRGKGKTAHCLPQVCFRRSIKSGLEPGRLWAARQPEGLQAELWSPKLRHLKTCTLAPTQSMHIFPGSPCRFHGPQAPQSKGGPAQGCSETLGKERGMGICAPLGSSWDVYATQGCHFVADATKGPQPQLMFTPLMQLPPSHQSSFLLPWVLRVPFLEGMSQTSPA